MSENKSPTNAIAESEGLAMSPAERAKASILVVESDSNERNNLKQACKSLGYGNISDAPNHATALERIQQRRVTHIIFESKKTNMPAKEFLAKVLEMDPGCIAVPASWEPNVDDVFDMLIMGARGFLVKPFTTDTVEAAMLMASKGEPIADAVLHAKDRNEALVAIMMASLDKAATVLRQASQFETAKREIPKSMAHLRRSAELAKTIAKGGDDGLMEAMEKFCIERSKGPATRLGRLRKRLKTGRAPDEAATGGEGGAEETEAAKEA
jgi:response regulator RpfG family c-di-GMP phosphodiesterase